MKFDDFLETHQALIDKSILNGGLDPDEVKAFTSRINICIDAYVEVHDRLKFEIRRWSEAADRLCQLRDQIQKLRKDDNGAYQSNHTQGINLTAKDDIGTRRKGRH